MERRWRAVAAGGFVVGIFLFVQLSALALVGPFERAGYRAVENPQDPTNSVVYVVAILVVTALMLAAFRYGVDQLIRAIVVLAGAWLSLYLFRVLVPPVVAPAVPGVGTINLLAWVLAGGLGVALYVYPEWYVVDAAGAIMGAAAAGLFGISFGLFPALVLLAVLAVYDAISVYGTEHMLTLASGVMDLKVPVVLVVPTTLSYSFLNAEPPDPDAADGEAGASEKQPDVDGRDRSATSGDGPDGDGRDGADASAEEPAGESGPDEGPLDRNALFIGLGDAVIPSVLVASAAVFVPATVPRAFGIAVPALTAMVGTLVGLVVLLWMVFKGRAHAGLPLLNGGSIAGYLVGALAVGMSLVDALGVAQYL
ncbi:MAG: presenilin family intramembrane aspartyl protease PSH [Haloarculaceae archaeon]